MRDDIFKLNVLINKWWISHKNDTYSNGYIEIKTFENEPDMIVYSKDLVSEISMDKKYLEDDNIIIDYDFLIEALYNTILGIYNDFKILSQGMLDVEMNEILALINRIYGYIKK